MVSRKMCMVGATVALAGSAAMARPFIPGNLVVSRVGDGSAALAATGTAAFLSEFTTAGSLVGTTPIPTSASGLNRQMTLSGTATSEGFLTLSSDGRYLTMGGYDGAVGSAIVGTPSNAVNRVVARIDDNAVIDTTTAIADTASPGNPRSVCSADGSGFWMGTSAGGIRFVPFGGNASTQLSTTITNTRVTNLSGGQLYASSASGAFQGVSTVGSGSPTTAGQTITLLAGMPTAAGPSAYDYYFANSTTMYVADDRVVASGGGLQKWTFSGAAWSLAATFNTNLTAGLRGLTGTTDSFGNTVLYAVTADAITAAAGNKLVTLTDTGASSAFTVLATAPGNTAFRGVDFAPVPTPGTLGLLSIAGLFGARRRR